MLVKCELCGAAYNVSDDKVKGKSFRFSCKNCGNTVHVKQEVDAPAVESPMWYLAWAKDRKGPFTVEQVLQLLLESKPAEDVYAWKAGFQTWVKLSEVKELQSVVEALAAPEKAVAAQPGTNAVEAQASAEKEKIVESGTHAEKSETDGASESGQHKDTVTRKLRPSFTELVAAKSTGDSKKETGKIDRAKVDLSQLASKSAAAPKDSPVAMAESAAKAPDASVKAAPVIKHYVPPVKKKLPIMQWAMLTLLFVGAIGTPLTLNLYHVIEIPGITKVPLIGGLFKVEEVDHYAKLRDQWEMLVKIDEAKVKLQALKEEEFEKEKQRKLDDEERQRREERRQRLMAYHNANRPKNGNGRALDEGSDYFDDGSNGGSVTEISFGNEENIDVDFETGDSLEVNNIQRKEVLTQEIVSGVIRQSMGRIGACVAEQKRKQPMPGTLMVNFTINRRGTVVSTSITTSQYEGSFVGDCIANVIENLHFPKSGGSINMSYPFSIQ